MVKSKTLTIKPEVYELLEKLWLEDSHRYNTIEDALEGLIKNSDVARHSSQGTTFRYRCHRPKCFEVTEKTTSRNV